MLYFTRRPRRGDDVPDIRTARPEDAKALALVAEATFRAAFGAMNAPGDMDRHCRDSFGERIQAAEIADPGRETLVVEHDRRLIGYAQLRWGEPPACIRAHRPAEIQRIYVVEGWHGLGVAQALMAACLDAIRRRGSDAAWLGVWEHNPRAIAFYRKFGFVEAGEHVFPLGGDPQRDVVMVKSIMCDDRPVGPGAAG
jgi:ribosomal protein S18 acetylase RimI-like enzyme